MPRLILPTLLMLVLVATATAAPIYKWRDADGSVHYEDTQPAQGEYQVIRPATPYRGPQENGQEAAVATDGDAAGATTDNAEERARNCAQSRESLAQAEAADRMYELDDKGERRYFSAAEVRAHIAELRAAVASWCEGQ
jgi:hypothetical protein